MKMGFTICSCFDGGRYHSLLRMVDGHPDVFDDTVTVDVCHLAVEVCSVRPFDLHYCVLGNFDERDLHDVGVEEVPKHAPEDGLMSHNQEGSGRSTPTLVLKPFQKRHQPLTAIDVRLALGIPISEFVVISALKLLRVLIRELLVGQTVQFPRINLVE